MTVATGNCSATLRRRSPKVLEIIRDALSQWKAARAVSVYSPIGAELYISPDHPTDDGRPFANLAAGEPLGGVHISSIADVPYLHAHTYDILPGSDTGTYVAGGALIGSTLWRPLER